ncbi:MAG TPA: porin [Solimonas sp.]|nr:porin [Solimonas sp.]
MFAKKLIAALAAASVAPAALAMDTSGSAYGAFRLSLGYFDSGSGEDVRVDNNNSYIGLRAQTVEGDITAFASYERFADNDNTYLDGEFVRQFYGGLRHRDYGTLIFGRAPTAYKLSGQKLDPFYATAVSGLNGGTTALSIAGGAGYGMSALTGDVSGSGFVSNQLAYTSPSYGGVTVNGAVFFDDGGGASEEVDYGAGVEYSAGGLTAGVQLLDISTGSSPGSQPNFFTDGLTGASGKLTALRGYGGYADVNWGAGASYELLDLGNDLPDRTYMFASAWYGLSQYLRVAAVVGRTEDTPYEGMSYTVGASYEIVENLNTYVAARYVDRQLSEASSAQTDDTQTYALGVAYNFEIGFGN